MGTCFSSNTLTHLDDSVHVMMKHDQKKAKSRGEPLAYVPRAQHPLLPKEGATSGTADETAEKSESAPASGTDGTDETPKTETAPA